MSTIEARSIVFEFENVGYPTLINQQQVISPGGDGQGGVGTPLVSNGGAFNQNINPAAIADIPAFGNPVLVVPPSVTITAANITGVAGSVIAFAEVDNTPPTVDLNFIYLLGPSANVQASAIQFDNLISIAVTGPAARIQVGCIVDIEVISPEDEYDIALISPSSFIEIYAETESPITHADAAFVSSGHNLAMSLTAVPPEVEITSIDLEHSPGLVVSSATMSIDTDLEMALPGLNTELAFEVEVERNFNIESSLQSPAAVIEIDLDVEQELNLDWALTAYTGKTEGFGAARATLYSPFMGRIAVDQPQGGTYYPFYSKPENEFLLDNVYDFYVAYDPGTCPIRLPLALTVIGGLNDDAEPGDLPEGVSPVVHKYDVTLVDADGVVVYNTVHPVWKASVRKWSSRFDVIEWISESAVIRMVRKIAFLSDADKISYPNYLDLRENPAMLQPRVVVAMARRVKSIQIDGQEKRYRSTAIELDLGMNVVSGPITSQIDQLRQETEITFNADALEEFNPCDDPTVSDDVNVVRTINKIQPNEVGAFLLSGDGCYRVQRPTVVNEGENTLVVPGNEITIHHDNCVPCCDCNDYIGAHRIQEKLMDRLVGSAERIERARDLLYSINHRIAEKAKELQQNPVTLTIEAACPGIIKIGTAVCNFEECAIEDVRLDLTLNNYSGLDRAYIDYNTVFANNGLCSEMLPTVIPNQQNWPTSTAILTYSWNKVAGNGNAALRLVIRSRNSSEGEFQVVARFYIRRLVNGAYQEFPLGSLNKTVAIAYPDPVTGRCGDMQQNDDCE